MNQTESDGRIAAICISETRGIRKTPVERAELAADHGIIGDAHAGAGHRQVSLLSAASVRKIADKGVDTFPGIFAENLLVEGADLSGLRAGDLIAVGQDVLLEVTQIGKECHDRCSIYYQAGECAMPREGVFARVAAGGSISVDSVLRVLPAGHRSEPAAG